MTKRKTQSFKGQFALLAHVYKLEIIELSSMVGLWLVGVATDFYVQMWSIARYSMSHQRRHR